MSKTANIEAAGATCATDGSCCGGANKNAKKSSVTALSPVELMERGARWKALLARLVDYEQSEEKLALRFNNSELNKTELESLIEMERVCCSHISWQIEETSNYLSLILRSDSKSLLGIEREFLSTARSD